MKFVDSFICFVICVLFANCCGAQIKSNVGGGQVRGIIGARKTAMCCKDGGIFDSEVEWIGWNWRNGVGSAKDTNIIIKNIPWDSFSICLYVPSTSLVGYRDGPGGLYSYWGCNRIGFNGNNYRGGVSFMGIQEGIPVITDRFVEYLSPSPSRLYWIIDGTEYKVSACRNNGDSDFGVITQPNATSLGYYVSWCKLYYNGEMTCDLIPVRFSNEKGDPEGGMFDKISGSIFRNVGYGFLEIGPDK